MSVFYGEILNQVQNDEPKILPPMREIVMPDVLPSLLGLEIGVHIFALKKSPEVLENSRGILEEYYSQYLRNNTTP
jgi:hypothetical protein